VSVVSVAEARHAMYRQQVLNAAEIEFGKAGFADTRMDAIAATAGLSLATVYKTFAGKSEIWDALHKDRMDALLASVEGSGDEGQSGLDRLLASVAAVARFLADNPAYLELNIRVGGWASSYHQAHGVQRSVWSAGIDMLAAGIQHAVDVDRLPAIRPQIGAAMVVSALQAWLTDWVVQERDRDIDAVIDEMQQHLRWMLAGSR
jgi:AcrR family transcriptional regulator